MILTTTKEVLDFARDVSKPHRFKAKDDFAEYNAEREVDDTGCITVFVYGKRRRRYGTRYTPEQFATSYTVKYNTLAEEEKKWKARLKKAIQCMDQTDLWKDTGLYTTFTNLLTVELRDKQRIEELYWSQRIYVNGLPTLNWSLFDEYIKKYPFIFKTDASGNMYIDTDYIWEKSNCILKSMYFGKYRNKRIKSEIADALKNKTKYTADVIAGYDVRFEYDPENSRAWYSEEYRGCGNGHYYIALNENTALFIEND